MALIGLSAGWMERIGYRVVRREFMRWTAKRRSRVDPLPDDAFNSHLARVAEDGIRTPKNWLAELDTRSRPGRVQRGPRLATAVRAVRKALFRLREQSNGRLQQPYPAATL
jgi:hypothetical protein